MNPRTKNTDTPSGATKRPGRKRMDPKLKKIPVAYKLSPWLVAWMRKQDASCASLIEAALIDKFNLKKY